MRCLHIISLSGNLPISMAAPSTSYAFWPDVSTIDGARRATRQGIAAALLSVGITALFALYALTTGEAVLDFISAWSLVDVAIFGLIAYGLHREWRAAAVGGLAFFLIEKIDQMHRSSMGSVGGAGVATLMILCYISAIRGTFALHRLRQGGASEVVSGERQPTQ